jgi:hypothetical protein
MKKPMILDVNPDPDALDWEEDLLARFDISTIGCCGPDARGGCPLLSNQPCAKIDAADGVLFQLDLDRFEHRRILTKYMQQLSVPIRVVVTQEQRERWARFLAPVEVFVPPIGPAKLDALAAEVESELPG